MSSSVGLNKNSYNRPNPVGKHGNTPPFYMYNTHEKCKLIGNKSVEA